jgi:hypothetical protein
LNARTCCKPVKFSERHLSNGFPGQLQAGAPKFKFSPVLSAAALKSWEMFASVGKNGGAGPWNPFGSFLAVHERFGVREKTVISMKMARHPSVS